MVATILSISEIMSDPQVRGGRPVIAGTGLKVSDVFLARTTGDKFSPEEIAEHYGVTLGQVHAALAYYYLHQNEIDEEVRSDADDAKKLLTELMKQGKVAPIYID